MSSCVRQCDIPGFRPWGDSLILVNCDFSPSWNLFTPAFALASLSPPGRGTQAKDTTWLYRHNRCRFPRSWTQDPNPRLRPRTSDLKLETQDTRKLTLISKPPMPRSRWTPRLRPGPQIRCEDNWTLKLRTQSLCRPKIQDFRPVAAGAGPRPRSAPPRHSLRKLRWPHPTADPHPRPAGSFQPPSLTFPGQGAGRSICPALPAYWACALLQSLLGNVVLTSNLAERGRRVPELQVRIPSLHLRSVRVVAGLCASFLNCKMGLIIAIGFLRLWSLFQGMAYGKI